MPPPGPTTALMLGNVQFMDFEVPDEIDQFGGYASLVEHEFAGGTVTIQRFGRFPVKLISWSGQFFTPNNTQAGAASGGGLFGRVAQVDQLLTTGGPIPLTFGPYNFLVEIASFYQKPRNTWWVPYTISLRPYADQTNWNQNGGGTTGGGGAGIPVNVPTAVSSPFAPTVSTPPISNPNSPLFSDNGSPNLIQNNAQLGGLLTSNQFTATPPQAGIAAATPALTNFQQSLGDALQASTGTNPNSTLLQGQLSTAQQAVTAAAASTDPGTQAFSVQAGSLLGAISQQLTPLNNSIELQPIANPNLEAISLQYYGDPNLWTQIASANVGADGNRILTPNPIGILTLTIPGNTQTGNAPTPGN